jgi:hypothetical protein
MRKRDRVVFRDTRAISTAECQRARTLVKARKGCFVICAGMHKDLLDASNVGCILEPCNWSAMHTWHMVQGVPGTATGMGKRKQSN